LANSRPNETESYEITRNQTATKGVKQAHFGAIPTFGSSRIPFKKMIGLQDAFGKADLSVGTIIGEDLISVTARNTVDTQEDYVQT